MDIYPVFHKTLVVDGEMLQFRNDKTHYINPNIKIESLYAHCDEIFVEEGEFVQ